jgi:hypothetical protein
MVSGNPRGDGTVTSIRGTVFSSLLDVSVNGMAISRYLLSLRPVAESPWCSTDKLFVLLLSAHSVRASRHR